MKMDKKTMAYILIGGGVIAILVYLFMQMKAKAAAAKLGAGMPENRGTWAAADDALYARFRSMFSADELNWIDLLVENMYNSNGAGDGDKIKGISSKAGTFARVIYNVAPNSEGTYPPLAWGGGQPSLWPASTMDKLFTGFNQLKAKYGGL